MSEGLGCEDGVADGADAGSGYALDTVDPAVEVGVTGAGAVIGSVEELIVEAFGDLDSGRDIGQEGVYVGDVVKGVDDREGVGYAEGVGGVVIPCSVAVLQANGGVPVEDPGHEVTTRAG